MMEHIRSLLSARILPPPLLPKLIILELVLVLLMWLAVSLSYCIPTELLEDHVEESMEILSEEGRYPNSYTGEPFDNPTVFTMLEMASQPSMGNPFTTALLNPRLSVTGDWSERITSVSNAPNGTYNDAYYRYWHGYLVILKPLLIVCNVKEIRLIFQTAFFLMLCIACISLTRAKLAPIAIALCMSLALIGAADAASTLPVFFSFFIALVGVAWIGRQGTGHSTEQSPSRSMTTAPDHIFIGFMLLGAFTAYFDFLDNPLLTFGLPAVTLICSTCSHQHKREAWHCIRTLLCCCASWGFGYGCTWLAKWVIAHCLTDFDVIGQAVTSILYRSGLDNGESSFVYGSPLDAVCASFQTLGFIRYIVIACVLFIIACLVVIPACSLSQRANTAAISFAKKAAILLFVALLPYAWFLLLSNHTLIHLYFAYRTQAVALFALFSGVHLCLMGIRSFRQAASTTALLTP